MSLALLSRAPLSSEPCCRSDLTGAKIDGTDFSNALLDKTQQIVRLHILQVSRQQPLSLEACYAVQALCRYASGQNSVTGVDTRKSLGCGSRRRYAESTPSNEEGSQVRGSCATVSTFCSLNASRPHRLCPRLCVVCASLLPIWHMQGTVQQG